MLKRFIMCYFALFIITSGSPVCRLVCISIFPIRISLHTSLTACSIVSPARKIETPHILSVAARLPS